MAVVAGDGSRGDRAVVLRGQPCRSAEAALKRMWRLFRRGSRAALAREASSGERGANKAEPGQAAPPETAVPLQSAEQPPTLEIPIEDILDLHEFSPRQSGELVETYLAEACAKGF